MFSYLWKISSFRACADGGANRLYQAHPELVPDLIRGDLDSLQPSVRLHYEKYGTRVEEDPDQNTNDLDKVLQWLYKQQEQQQKHFDGGVIVYGAFGGRFDQVSNS